MPARPECTTPHIRFLFVALHLWIGLPSDDALALFLTFGSANTWYGDFHPASYVSCLAHTPEVSGGYQPSAEVKR